MIPAQYNSPEFRPNGFNMQDPSLDTGFSSMSNYGSPKTGSGWIVAPTAPPSFMPSYAQNQAYDQIDGWGSMTPQPQSGAAMGGGGGVMDGFNKWAFGGTDDKGMKTTGGLGTTVGAIQGIGNLYMGMKNYGLAKDAFNEGKRQYEQNYAAQKQTTNASLEDRQRARVASNSSAYQSVGDYMNKNGIR